MSEKCQLGSGNGVQPPRRSTRQEGPRSGASPRSSARIHRRCCFEKSEIPYFHRPCEMMIIPALVACCCLMTGYPRLAVHSIRSTRLRTELTIGRRTNAISEWAFRRRYVRRHGPGADTLQPMRGRQCVRASQPPRCRRSLPADSENRLF